jgi:ribosomal protein S16
MTLENDSNKEIKMLYESLSGFNLDLELLFKHREVILADSSIDFMNLLEKVLRALNGYVVGKYLIKLQGEMLELLMNRANINDLKYFSYNEIFTNHYNLLLSHPINPMNPNTFLKPILSSSITEYDSAFGKYTLKADKIKLQSKMIKAALDKGANPNDSEFYFNFEVLTNNYDLLLSHPTNPMNISIFLKSILSSSTTEYDSASGKNIPNTDKIKLQSEMLKAALDKGANPNDSEFSFNFEVLANNYDLLLSHPNHPMNTSIFLKQILSSSITEYDSVSGKHIPNADKIKLQSEMLKATLDKGANPNDSEFSFNFEVLANNYDLLLSHPINPMNPDTFLKPILSLYIAEYDSASGKYIANADKVKLQSEMLKAALDKGANPNDSEFYFNFEILANHYDLLLKHPTNPMSPNIFLKPILSSYINEYDSASGKYIPNAGKIKLQSEMIKAALDKGANPNDSEFYFNFEVLANNYDLLLSHPINPMNISIFLKPILSSSITEYDSASGKHIPNADKIKLQAELINLSLDKGANINSEEFYFMTENLYNHHDLLLNHPTNPISQERFLSLISSNSYSIDENGKHVYEENYIKLKIELFEIAYKNAKNSLAVDDIHLQEILVIKGLITRGVIDDETLFKLALKTSCITRKEEKSSYNLDKVLIQKQILEDFLAKGLTIENLSFKELNIEDNHISVLKLLLSAGLDPKALQIHSLSNEDAIEVLNLAFENNIKMIAFNFIIMLIDKNSADVAQLIIKNIGFTIDDKLSPEQVKNEFIEQGPKFEEYFADLTKDVDFESAIMPVFASGGSILHMLVKSDKQEIVKFVLENYQYNINSLNDLGQTPLFFAQSAEVARELIAHQANLSTKDNKGNIWVSNPSLELIEFAVENDYLPKDYAERVALNHFSKVNYEHAAKLYKIGFDLNADPVFEMVESIINGLENSIEINIKYTQLT